MDLKFLFHFLHFSPSQQEKRDPRGILLILLVSALGLLFYSFAISRGDHNLNSLLSRQYLGRLDLLGSRRQHDATIFLRSHRASQSPTEKLLDHNSQNPPSNKPLPLNEEQNNGKCEGKYVYIYKLPPHFNDDLVEKCRRTTDIWVPLCGNLNNNGYGPSIPTNSFNLNSSHIDTLIELEPPHAWYRTEQFSLEVIFHERLKTGYPCMTLDAEQASAFYIPYYAALDTAFTLFDPHLPRRDRLVQQLIGWLSGSQEWRKFQGVKKHFMVLGRISWDFSRDEELLDGWGSALMSQVELSNVTKLLIERRPWATNEMAIPYPTSFHPSSSTDVEIWQEKLRGRMSKRRKLLSSFIGSTSRGNEWSRALRAVLAEQCNQVDAKTCLQFKCGYANADDSLDCARNPEHVNALFLSSTFCLQPSGDSPTRKGIFDSLLAGCIPVLFSESSAYTQYVWHLPQNGSIYSVFFNGDDVIHGNVDIFAALARIANDTQRLRRMQDEIINILPRIVYSLSPSDHSSGAIFHDAVDVALESLLTGAPITTL